MSRLVVQARYDPKLEPLQTLRERTHRCQTRIRAMRPPQFDERATIGMHAHAPDVVFHCQVQHGLEGGDFRLKRAWLVDSACDAADDATVRAEHECADACRSIGSHRPVAPGVAPAFGRGVPVERLDERVTHREQARAARTVAAGKRGGALPHALGQRGGAETAPQALQRRKCRAFGLRQCLIDDRIDRAGATAMWGGDVLQGTSGSKSLLFFLTVLSGTKAMLDVM